MINESRNIFSQNNPVLNSLKSSPVSPNTNSNIYSQSPQKRNLDYSSSDQVTGPRIDSIYRMLGKFFESYETLINNYKVVVSTNNDFYSQFLNKLEHDEGLQVGNLNEGVMPPADEQSLTNKTPFELIQTIKTQNAHLIKCNQAFKHFQQLLGTAKVKLDEQKQTQNELTDKARTILRAYSKKDDYLLEQLQTSIPVANKPRVDESLKVGNVDNSQQPLNINPQDNINQAQKEALESRSRAIEAEKNILGSSSTVPIQAGINPNNLPPTQDNNNSPFLNLSQGSPLLGQQTGSPNQLLPLGSSSGINMESSQNSFGDLQPVELEGMNKEKGIVLSGQPIGGGGDYLRYRVLFNKNNNLILKYLSGNSLKKINYQANSFSWSTKINYILKHNITSDFGEIKKRAHEIWSHPESKRLSLLELEENPANRQMLIQYGIFKRKKSVRFLSPVTEDVFFIDSIPQGFEYNNLIKFAFPTSVQKGLFDVDIYVIQLATQNPRNTQFYNVSPNDILGELMRQWGVFIQNLTEKKKQLKIIYEREYNNIRGFTTRALKNGLKNKIHNIAVDTLNSINKPSTQYEIEKKNNQIPSEREYFFFNELLKLSVQIYREMNNLMETYNQFGYPLNNKTSSLNNSTSLRKYTPFSGGGDSIKSRKNNKIKRRLCKKSIKHIRN